LASYFSSPDFRHYLLGVTGSLHYALPGVFSDNPVPRIINSQLWTVPWELKCYLLLFSLSFVGLKQRHWLAPTAMVLVILGYFVTDGVLHHWQFDLEAAFSGTMLFGCFLAGVSFYLYRKWVPWSPLLCLLSLAISSLILAFVPGGEYLVVPFEAYFTVSLGIMNPTKPSFLQGNDYSYGIYLYGYVIQQTLMANLLWARHWWINLPLTVSIATIVAVASWHFIEKPALGLRRYLQPGRKGQPRPGQPPAFPNSAVPGG
jgi:peptidoglycan/LPS O-acetylase OafA/YrhL